VSFACRASVALCVCWAAVRRREQKKKEKSVCYSVCMCMATRLGCKLVRALEVISMSFI
jgi:hypothetical protein